MADMRSHRAGQRAAHRPQATLGTQCVGARASAAGNEEMQPQSEDDRQRDSNPYGAAARRPEVVCCQKGARGSSARLASPPTK